MRGPLEFGSFGKNFGLMHWLTSTFLVAISLPCWSSDKIRHEPYVTNEETVLLACYGRDSRDGTLHTTPSRWVAIQRSDPPVGGILDKGAFEWSAKFKVEVTPISYTLVLPWSQGFYIDRRTLSAVEGWADFQCASTSLDQIESETKEMVEETIIQLFAPTNFSGLTLSFSAFSAVEETLNAMLDAEADISLVGLKPDLRPALSP